MIYDVKLKILFSSAIFGHVYQPNGCQAPIDSCDLSLPNLGEHPDTIPQHVVLRFSGTLQFTCFNYFGSWYWI